jgi:hypothetical protein
VSVQSEWYREKATEHVALRKLIEASGETALVGLMKERDALFMDAEMTREIHAEWGHQARQIAPIPEGDRSCDCSTCAISRALNLAARQVAA